MTNSTFSVNTGGTGGVITFRRGGAIYVGAGTTTLNNDTITGNLGQKWSGHDSATVRIVLTVIGG